MKRREFTVVTVGGITGLAGCTGYSAEDTESSGGSTSSSGGSESRTANNNDVEGRADLLFRNKTDSSVTLTMRVSDDSGAEVLERSYQLSPQEDNKSEVRETIKNLRDKLYNYTFKTDSGLKESREYGASSSEQLRVIIRSSGIETTVVA